MVTLASIYLFSTFISLFSNQTLRHATHNHCHGLHKVPSISVSEIFLRANSFWLRKITKDSHILAHVGSVQDNLYRKLETCISWYARPTNTRDAISSFAQLIQQIMNALKRRERLLRAFAKLRKVTIRHVCPSVRPPARNNSAPAGRIFIKFHI